MRSLTDIHQHLLWGIDDGPRSPRMMQHMLDEAAAQNITTVFATPHAMPGIKPFDMELYEARLAEARQYCANNSLDISILPGAEIAWTYYTVEALRKHQIPTMNDTDYALIEFWPGVSWDEITEACKKLLRAGCRPLIAHVERYRCFRWFPMRAVRLREELPIAYQVNASSVIYGSDPIFNRFIRIMLEERGFDAVASDAHDMHNRPQLMGKAYAVLNEVCGSEYADALVNYFGV